MSNTEFVMVPRVPTDEMIVAFAEAWYSKRQCIDDPDMLDAYAEMLAVAPEHQGEPVAWRVGSQIFQQEHLAKLHSGGVRKPVEPLYAHSDPAEVERLLAASKRQQGVINTLECELMDLRAQLAERDALLRIYESFPGYLIDHCEGNTIYEESLQHWLAEHIKSLPASAEPSEPALVECDACPRSGGCLSVCMKAAPSAPVERDERAEFESFHRKHLESSGMDPQDIDSEFDRKDNGDYVYILAADAWPYWKARAALERKS